MKKIIFISTIYLLFQINLIGQPSMSYPDIIDFGIVLQNSDPIRKFIFYNIGDEPLAILNAKASVGYLIPKWPKESLLPGDSAVFEIRYDTKKLGVFSKNISIITNEGTTRVINIFGEIKTENGTSLGGNEVRKKIYFDAGMSYTQSKKYSSAIDNFTIAIYADSEYTEAYHFRGLCKSNIGDSHGAISDFSKAINTNPSYIDSYLFRGMAKFKIGEYNDAVTDLTKVIDMKSTNTKALLLRAISYERTNKYKEAINDYTMIIESEPTNAQAYFGRGMVKGIVDYGDHQGAISDYTKAIELEPNDAMIYYSRGLVKNLLQDFRGAIEDYNKAISISNTESKFYESRGWSKYYLSHKNEACLDFHKSKELGNADVIIDIKKYCD